jgi:hypothetical protein
MMGLGRMQYTRFNLTSPGLMPRTLLLFPCAPCVPPSCGTCAAAHACFFFSHISSKTHMGKIDRKRSNSCIGMLRSLCYQCVRIHSLARGVRLRACGACLPEPRALATAQFAGHVSGHEPAGFLFKSAILITRFPAGFLFKSLQGFFLIPRFPCLLKRTPADPCLQQTIRRSLCFYANTVFGLHFRSRPLSELISYHRPFNPGCFGPNF